MTATAQKNYVWPVFVVALGLLSVGVYTALAGSEQVAVDDVGLAGPFIRAVREAPSFDATPMNHKLAVGGEGAVYRVELLQEQRRGEDRVRTRLSLEVTDAEAAAVGGNYVFLRSYGDVGLEVGFAAQTSKQVQQLVGSAIQRVTLKPTGETVSVELTSADALQMRPVLELLQQSIALTMPRFPREPVRTAETWAWSLPGSVEGEAVDGKIDVTARVLGTTKEGVLLRLDLRGGIVLDLSADEAHPHVMNANGTGHGLVLWNVEHRRVAWSEVSWEQQSEVGGLKVHTTSLLRRFSE